MSELTGNAVKVSILQSLASATLPSVQDSAGTEYGRFCRAFVNFNGSSASIRASFNVSSISRNSTGNYTVNCSPSLPDANYTVVACGAPTATPTTCQRWPAAVGTLASDSVRILTPNDGTTGASLGDFALVNVTIFR